MTKPIANDAMDQIFFDARTYNGWKSGDVSDTQLKRLVEITVMGPTSANCQPARFQFLRSDESKARLEPLLDEGNRAKTMAAPVIAIIGYDLEFHERLPRYFPHTDAKSWFAGQPDKILETARRNGTLQGAYLIIAARALGLDTGPMSGFDAKGVDEAFWSGTQVKTDFLCNIGVGDPDTIFPRSPRPDFDEVAQIL